MIQRIQSVYLSGIGICFALLLIIPISKFSSADVQIVVKLSGIEKISSSETQIIAGPQWLLILDLLLIISIAFTAIFLFKKRKTQIVLCNLIMVLIALFFGLEFLTTQSLSEYPNAEPSFAIGAFLPVLAIALAFMAQKAIRKDEELVKSADRLR